MKTVLAFILCIIPALAHASTPENSFDDSKFFKEPEDGRRWDDLSQEEKDDFFEKDAIYRKFKANEYLSRSDIYARIRVTPDEKNYGTVNWSPECNIFYKDQLIQRDYKDYGYQSPEEFRDQLIKNKSMICNHYILFLDIDRGRELYEISREYQKVNKNFYPPTEAISMLNANALIIASFMALSKGSSADSDKAKSWLNQEKKMVEVRSLKNTFSVIGDLCLNKGMCPEDVKQLSRILLNNKDYRKAIKADLRAWENIHGRAESFYSSEDFYGNE